MGAINYGRQIANELLENPHSIVEEMVSLAIVEQVMDLRSPEREQQLVRSVLYRPMSQPHCAQATNANDRASTNR